MNCSLLQPSHHRQHHRIIIMCLGTAPRRNNVALGYIRASEEPILRHDSSTITFPQGQKAEEFNPVEPAIKQTSRSHESRMSSSATTVASSDYHAGQSKEFQRQPVTVTKLNREHIIVQHHYHDHSLDQRTDFKEEHPARGGVSTPFPLKLHEMLENVQGDGYAGIISWQPHGRCFVVRKPKEFIELLPSYFKLRKLASFQRQLNLYGFQRMTRGRDRGGYYHELFLRGRAFLAHSIERIKVKGTGVRARSNPEQEPDFWGMEWIPEGNDTSNPSAAASAVRSNGRVTFPSRHYSSASGKIILASPIIPTVSASSVESSVAAMHRSNGNLTAPYNLYSRGNLVDDDIICAFGNKTFHYLDPFQPLTWNKPQGQGQEKQNRNHFHQQRAHNSPSMLYSTDQEDLLNAEAESFFDDFHFPDTIGSEIEDDATFGEMLEFLIG